MRAPCVAAAVLLAGVAGPVDLATAQDAQQLKAQQQPGVQQPGRAQRQDLEQVPTAAVAASRLEGMQVENARGRNVGSVDQVLIGRDRQAHVVLSYGGLLGIGQRQVMLPLRLFHLHENRLVLTAITDEQLQRLAPYEAQPGTQRAAPDQQVYVAVAEPATVGEQLGR
jgi:hypothetical protein